MDPSGRSPTVLTPIGGLSGRSLPLPLVTQTILRCLQHMEKNGMEQTPRLFVDSGNAVEVARLLVRDRPSLLDS